MNNKETAQFLIKDFAHLFGGLEGLRDFFLDLYKESHATYTLADDSKLPSKENLVGVNLLREDDFHDVCIKHNVGLDTSWEIYCGLSKSKVFTFVE